MNTAFPTLGPYLRWLGRVASMLRKAGVKFLDIDGEQRAAAFAYYAFFALFPLILLIVTLGSLFWENATVVNYVIDNLGQFLPFDHSDRSVIDGAIHGIADARGGIGLLAILGLVWSSTHFFHALVRGVNRAWGTIEYPWWRLPIHSTLMLGLVASALFIGVLVPLVIGYLRAASFLKGEAFGWLFDLAALLVPSLILFYGLSMFLKFSPRRRTRFSEVALAALLTTILLQVCRGLFAHYVYEFSNFNAVYGTFAIVVVLLMWIYLSGVIIIFGGCLCVAQAEVFGCLKHSVADSRRSQPSRPSEAAHSKPEVPGNQ